MKTNADMKPEPSGNTPELKIESCPDCGIIYSMMEPGGITDWGCSNVFHSRGRVAASSKEATPDLKIDGKFSIRAGQIVNTVSGEPIPEDEPLFLLRGRDHNALSAIDAYQDVCEDECNELHMAGIQQVREKFCQFAAYHPERMKQPGVTRHLKLSAEATPSPATKSQDKRVMSPEGHPITQHGPMWAEWKKEKTMNTNETNLIGAARFTTSAELTEELQALLSVVPTKDFNRIQLFKDAPTGDSETFRVVLDKVAK